MSTPAPPPYVPAHGLLKGRSILITAAAGGGIGFAAAKRCIEEGARAVMISDIHPRRLDEAAQALRAEAGDCAVHAQLANVAVEDEVQALVPASEIHGMIIELRSMSMGLGSYVHRFDHLAEVQGAAAARVAAGG